MTNKVTKASEVRAVIIPNNSAPDSSLTWSLEGLRALSHALKEHSGIDIPWDSMMKHSFGRWSGLIGSLVALVLSILIIFILCDWCCFPCPRGLCVKCIDSAIGTVEPVKSPPHLMSELVALIDSTGGDKDDGWQTERDVDMGMIFKELAEEEEAVF